MKLGRILISGIAVTIFGAVAGAVTCGGIFNWVYKLEPTNVWKPMDGPPGAMFMIGGLILNIILSFVYVLLKKGIPGKKKVIKGAVFGLCVWATGILPGMFSMYSFMTVATTVVVYWTIIGLVESILKGMIIAAVCGDR